MVAAPPWGFDELPPTGRWLLARGLPTLRDAPTAPLSDVSWTALRQACTQHGLDGLLVAAVAAGEMPATSDQREHAAATEVRLTNQRMAYEASVLPILDELASKGIDVRVLKGAAVARLDYPDDQMRSTSDLDLLVKGSQIRAAVAALVEAGGRWTNPEPAPGYLEGVGKGATVLIEGMEVDLHRLLGWGPLGIRLDPAMPWGRAQPFDLGPRRCLALGREERFLHACQHLVLLGAIRAREVRDVAQIASHPEFDERFAIATAERWGTQVVVAQAVLLAERELAVPDGVMPLTRWARALKPPLLDRLWTRADRPTSPLVGVDQLAMLWELHDWRSRLLIARANVLPLEGSDPGIIGRAPRAVSAWRSDVSARAARRRRRASVARPGADNIETPTAEGTIL